ncbi:MAG: hypothetical protein V5A27_11330 [Halapricum sp.]
MSITGLLDELVEQAERGDTDAENVAAGNEEQTMRFARPCGG